MPSLLNIIIGVKKSADSARKGKKGRAFGFMGSGTTRKSYDEAQEALEDDDSAEEGEEKK